MSLLVLLHIPVFTFSIPADKESYVLMVGSVGLLSFVGYELYSNIRELCKEKDRKEASRAKLESWYITLMNERMVTDPVRTGAMQALDEHKKNEHNYTESSIATHLVGAYSIVLAPYALYIIRTCISKS